MVTLSAISSTSACGCPASISARSLARMRGVPSRTKVTSTFGCFALKASMVCCASCCGWLV